MNTVYSTTEVMKALGGNKGSAAVTGYSPKAVSNWRKSKTFPAKTYATMIIALHARGYDAPASLWGMKIPFANYTWSAQP